MFSPTKELLKQKLTKISSNCILTQNQGSVSLQSKFQRDFFFLSQALTQRLNEIGDQFYTEITNSPDKSYTFEIAHNFEIVDNYIVHLEKMMELHEPTFILTCVFVPAESLAAFVFKYGDNEVEEESRCIIM